MPRTPWASLARLRFNYCVFISVGPLSSEQDGDEQQAFLQRDGQRVVQSAGWLAVKLKLVLAFCSQHKMHRETFNNICTYGSTAEMNSGGF